MSKSNFNITLSFCFKPEPSNTFHSLIPLPIVKNVVFRRTQIQRSCSIADWAQRIELSKIKRMIIRNISIHRICDIMRRARCLLTDIFHILNIFLLLISSALPPRTVKTKSFEPVCGYTGLLVRVYPPYSACCSFLIILHGWTRM